MTVSLKELAPRFEKATGHKLDMTFVATPDLIKLATSAPFDLGVVPTEVMKDAGAKAKFAAAPIEIVRAGTVWRCAPARPSRTYRRQTR
jgi:molybdate transport system substrate-binding protein